MSSSTVFHKSQITTKTIEYLCKSFQTELGLFHGWTFFTNSYVTSMADSVAKFFMTPSKSISMLAGIMDNK